MKKTPCSFPSCSKVFSSWNEMKKHREIEHEKPSQEIAFNTDSASSSHEQTDTTTTTTENDSSLFSCDICLKDFKKKSLLKKHFNSNHLNSSTHKIECDLCEVNFTRKSSLKQHMISKHGKRKPKYRCFHCIFKKNIFETKQELKAHVLEAHYPSSSEEDAENFQLMQSAFEGLAQSYVLVLQGNPEQRNDIDLLHEDRFFIKMKNLISAALCKMGSIKYSLVVLVQYLVIDSSTGEVKDKIFIHLRASTKFILSHNVKRLDQYLRSSISEITERNADLVSLRHSGEKNILINTYCFT